MSRPSGKGWCFRSGYGDSYLDDRQHVRAIYVHIWNTTDDQMWPSAELAEIAIRRLEQHSFAFPVEHPILRLVVDKIVVTDEQITIKHVIPLSDVRLQRQHFLYKFIR